MAESCDVSREACVGRAPASQCGCSLERDRCWRTKDKDEFEFEGRITLGKGNDGIDPDDEGVMVEFGDYSVTIPTGSFHRDRHDRKWQFRGRKPGITHVDIGDDGKFRRHKHD